MAAYRSMYGHSWVRLRAKGVLIFKQRVNCKGQTRKEAVSPDCSYTPRDASCWSPSWCIHGMCIIINVPVVPSFPTRRGYRWMLQIFSCL